MFTMKLKNGRELDVPAYSDRESLPIATQEHIWEYGMRQKVADSTAPVIKKSYDARDWNGASFDESVDNCAAACVEKLMNGDVGRRAPADPKAAEYRKIGRALAETDAATRAKVAELLGLNVNYVAAA